MRMYDMVKSHLERGLETFEKNLRSDIFKQQDTSSLSSDITAPNLQDIATSTPPSTLLVFPFVAALTNTFLSAFNELRHCAVLKLQDQLLDVLRETLIRMVQVLIEFKEEKTQALYKKKNELRFQHFIKILHVQFVPYVVTCYGHVWGTTHKRMDCSAVIQTILSKMKEGGLI